MELNKLKGLIDQWDMPTTDRDYSKDSFSEENALQQARMNMTYLSKVLEELPNLRKLDDCDKLRLRLYLKEFQERSERKPMKLIVCAEKSKYQYDYFYGEVDSKGIPNGVGFYSYCPMKDEDGDTIKRYFVGEFRDGKLNRSRGLLLQRSNEDAKMCARYSDDQETFTAYAICGLVQGRTSSSSSTSSTSSKSSSSSSSLSNDVEGCLGCLVLIGIVVLVWFLGWRVPDMVSEHKFDKTMNKVEQIIEKGDYPQALKTLREAIDDASNDDLICKLNWEFDRVREERNKKAATMRVDIAGVWKSYFVVSSNGTITEKLNTKVLKYVKKEDIAPIIDNLEKKVYQLYVLTDDQMERDDNFRRVDMLKKHFKL